MCMCNYVNGCRSPKTWHDFQVELYVLAGHNERPNKCENKEMMSEV